ncbi:MAG: hypothetical protein IPH20_05285 [Bacteroidales bacterium]|nr:hypothetical protein [Bacteroidales bacterium]
MNLRTIKYSFLICAFVLSLKANAQQAVVSLTGGVFSNSVFMFTSLEGGGAYDGKGSWQTGISLSKKVSQVIWLGGGFLYEKHFIEITPEYFPGVEVVSETETIQLFTVPLDVRFGFLKYFFVNTGLSFDFDISQGSQRVDSQSGIGWSAGFGAGIEYIEAYFSLNPAMKIYSLVAFNHEQNQQHLFQAGLLFSIGYLF